MSSARPCRRSRTLSEITGAEVWVKFENQQFTASYKERGALNRLTRLTEDERRRGVIAASAGNHAQGLAYHGGRLGIPVTIVMPTGTPYVKVQQTRAFAATVVIEGDSYDSAYGAAQTLCEARDLVSTFPRSTTTTSWPGRAPWRWRCSRTRPTSRCCRYPSAAGA